MTRPYVQIDAPNQMEQLRQHLSTMLLQFKALPGVVGLALNGSLSQGYADHLSEIELTFYLTPEAFALWADGGSPVPVGITKFASVVYVIKYVDLAQEEAAVWGSVKCWEASYADILYDPEQKLRALFDAKITEHTLWHAAEGHLMNCWWYNRLSGDIWIHREDVEQGHIVFNQAVLALIRALFAANEEHEPHEKWLVHLSRTLAWTPTDWPVRLRQALSTGDMTLLSLKIRQAVIDSLWDDVDAYILTHHCPDLPVAVMQRTLYEGLRLLAERGSLTLAEWEEHIGRDFLNRDPFYPVVHVEDGRVIFDVGALHRISPETMYSWHYSIVRAVIMDMER